MARLIRNSSFFFITKSWMSNMIGDANRIICPVTWHMQMPLLGSENSISLSMTKQCPMPFPTMKKNFLGYVLMSQIKLVKMRIKGEYEDTTCEYILSVFTFNDKLLSASSTTFFNSLCLLSFNFLFDTSSVALKFAL